MKDDTWETITIEITSQDNLLLTTPYKSWKTRRLFEVESMNERLVLTLTQMKTNLIH